MFDKDAVLRAMESSPFRDDPYQWKSAKLIRSLLEHSDAPAARSTFHPGHLTASAWILHPSEECILAIHHRRLDRWLPPGGHLDPGETPFEAARREALEETGVPLAADAAEIMVRVDVHAIPAGKGEPLHLHHDLCYAFRATSAELVLQEEEVHDAEWLSFEEAARRDGSFFTMAEIMTHVAALLRA